MNRWMKNGDSNKCQLFRTELQTTPIHSLVKAATFCNSSVVLLKDTGLRITNKGESYLCVSLAM